MTTHYDQEIRLHEATSKKVPSLIGVPDLIDAWRHERMFEAARPIIAAFPEGEWLTIGDGGQDAWMLSQMGARRVSASSISDARLAELQRAGPLAGIEIFALNAERIALADASVDLILCKEAFHHFPHPPLAFYEFLRVARRGFLLIEPAELPSPRALDMVRTFAKLALRRRAPVYELFEPVGNYIYRVQHREIARMLTAIQHPWFAIRHFNDFSTFWVVRQPRQHALARRLFEFGLLVQDVLVACHLMSPGLCALFVPIEPAPESLKTGLGAAGFQIVELPRNPYGPDDYQKPFNRSPRGKWF
jgi:ubiquinone/menaquinone biosynthesis C-methylase UbiE